MGDIFKRLEAEERSIFDLQEREEQEGGLSKGNLAELCNWLLVHHSFLRQ